MVLKHTSAYDGVDLLYHVVFRELQCLPGTLYCNKTVKVESSVLMVIVMLIVMA